MSLTPLPHERHWTVPTWLSDVCIGGLVIVSSFVPFSAEAHTPVKLLTVVLMVAAALVLPLRRRFGLPVLGVMLTIFVTGALFMVISPGFILPVAVAVYGIASTRPFRITAVVVAIVWVVVLSASWIFLPLNWFDARVIQQVAVVGFAAALGAAIQSRRAYVAAITERALRAEQTRDSEARRQVAEERLRIARDLHDAVAHQIAVINLHAGVASQALPDRPDDAEQSLATIREAARSVLSEISDLLRVLRSEPESGDLMPGRGSFGSLAQLDELVALFGLSGLTVRVSRRPEASSTASAVLAAEVDDAAYRVLYEALTNAHKHGSAQVANVTLKTASDALIIQVENPVSADSGASENLPPASGHGLIGMRERLQHVGGTLEASSRDDNHVFRLTATLPRTDSLAAATNAASIR